MCNEITDIDAINLRTAIESISLISVLAAISVTSHASESLIEEAFLGIRATCDSLAPIMAKLEA